MPVNEDMERALAHGRLLRGWMSDKGIKAPSLVQLVERQGQQISADYIRKLARGERELASLPIELREAVRRSLRVTASEWEAATGLVTAADIDPDSGNVEKPARPLNAAEKRGWVVPKQPEKPIPPALLEAAELYGDVAPELRIYGWQQTLRDLNHKITPHTPYDWLKTSNALAERIDPPEN